MHGEAVKNVVFDYNGTLAVSGILIPDIATALQTLQTRYKVFVITADTFGTAQAQLASIGIECVLLQPEQKGSEKAAFVTALGAHETACVGNGNNDIPMFEMCALAIAVVGREGCYSKAIAASDITVCDIRDAIDILMDAKKIHAVTRE